MILLKAEVNHPVINILKNLFKRKPDQISVRIDACEPLLMVRLCVNDRQTAKMQCVVQSATDILIGDIQHHNEKADYNKGYGSMMMDKLLSYACENGFHYIWGNLSDVDLGHKDRLHHFYEKFGFAITEYAEPDGCYYGKIELRL